MGQKMSRAVSVGLGTAVGSFAVAAMMSAATAPTAHADDFGAVIADIQAEETAGATAFANATADFGNGDTADGLTQLFISTDDELLGVANTLEVGTVDVFTNATVPPASDFEVDFATPTTIAESVTEAQTYFSEGVALTNVIDGLPTDEATLGLIALDNAIATTDQWILPDQIELIADLVNGGF
jgi:hypothetical protein